MRKPSEPLGGTCSISRPSRLTTSASARRVDPEIQALVVASVEDALDDAGRTVQSAEPGANQVIAGVAPRRVLDRRRADADRWHAPFGRARPLDDRLEEAGGRALPHEL